MCQHFDSDNKDMLYNYKVIYECLVEKIHPSCLTQEGRLMIAQMCICRTCKRDGPTIHACLSCVYLACHNNSNNNNNTTHCSHIVEHLRKSQHNFAVELTQGELYCNVCEDYIYSNSFDTKVYRILDRSKLRPCKRKRNIGLNSWEPDVRDIKLLLINTKQIKLEASSLYGLRGLCNMGNTCFMNSVLQAIIHTPVLRDFFLAEQHMCVTYADSEHCVVCEMRCLVQEFHNGKLSAFVPCKLLQLIWTHAHHMAGYEQQDAHEFFIATLDVLHRHLGGKTPTANSPQYCQCVIDTVFAGKLQSDLGCEKCKHTSTTIDPFRDISLDLGAVVAKLVPSENCSSTLDECLKRFTKAEDLDSSCSKCKEGQLMKKLSIKKLPIVLCFHLKRFEHSLHTKKISQYVRFPEELDISPFLAHKSDRLENMYSLFAVVNHSGCVQSGHYTCHIRMFKDWFHCDDAVISQVSLTSVMESEAYLLFYHQNIVKYS